MLLSSPVHLFLAALILAIPMVIYAGILFDRLIRVESERFRDRWVADGKPSGILWRTDECSSLSSSIAGRRVIGEWLLASPSWVKSDPMLLSTLLRIRFCLAAGVIIPLGGWAFAFLPLILQR